jgi:hypothetical protein
MVAVTDSAKFDVAVSLLAASVERVFLTHLSEALVYSNGERFSNSSRILSISDAN